MKNLSLTAKLSHPRETGLRRFQNPRRVLGGFTLVEVTLAIGIISFAFVAMFGMLPVGLNVSRQAMDTTIEAQIVQQMKTQALQTDFSMLGALSDADELYFDDQGKEVEKPQSVYRVKYSAVSSGTQLPEGASTSKLKTVTISLLNTKGSAERANADLATSKDAKKFTILIPDNGL